MHRECNSFLSEILVVYLLNPNGAREYNCALQYTSLVISSLSVAWFELVRIWSMHWKVKSEKVCGVLLKCIATSQVFLLVFMDDLWFLNLTLNSVVVITFFKRVTPIIIKSILPSGPLKTKLIIINYNSRDKKPIYK